MGNYSEVAESLAQEYDIDAFSIRDFTPLMLAAQEGHTDIVRLLLKAGADVNIANRSGRTALHQAASAGRLDIVRVLVAQGADVNAGEGNREAVRLALKAGGDGRAGRPSGRTPLHCAASAGYLLHCAASAGYLRVVEALIESGADINAASRIGCTPAIEAAQHKQCAVVAFLRTQGADMTLRDDEGMTASDWQAEGGLCGRAERLFREAFPDEFPTSDDPNQLPLASQRDEDGLRKEMVQGLSADEFAARHGRRILVFAYGGYRFRDKEVEQWAHRVAEVLFTPGLLDECEEKHLQGEELEDARKRRKRRARWIARDHARRQSAS